MTGPRAATGHEPPIARGKSDAPLGAGRAPTTPDAQTLEVYDARAAQYADAFGKSGIDTELSDFMALVPPGGRVLDLGCGPGRSAALMAEAGFAVDPLDASASMVRLAHDRFGLEARQGTFDDLDPPYDGIWANFSLLHMPRSALAPYLRQLRAAMRTDAPLHVGLKTGRGEGRDALGRFYAYHDPAEVSDWLRTAGFDPGPPRTGRDKGLAGTEDPWFVILSTAVAPG